MKRTEDSKLDELGKLVLRATIGGIMLFHGVGKMSHGVEGVKKLIATKGLPDFFAYGVYIGEVIAPLLMIVGFWSRTAALIVAFNMVVAILTAHAGDVFKTGPGGGWAIELQMLYLLGSLAVALLGPGRLSVSGMREGKRSR